MKEEVSKGERIYSSTFLFEQVVFSLRRSSIHQSIISDLNGMFYLWKIAFLLAELHACIGCSMQRLQDDATKLGNSFRVRRLYNVCRDILQIQESTCKIHYAYIRRDLRP